MSVEGIQELAKRLMRKHTISFMIYHKTDRMFSHQTDCNYKLDGHTHFYEYIWMNRFYSQTMQVSRFKVDKKVAKVRSSYVQQYLQCAISVLIIVLMKFIM